MADKEKTKTEANNNNNNNNDDYFNPYEDMPEMMQYSPGQKAIDLCKEHPYIPIGLIGAFGILGYGIRNFRNRGPGRTGFQYFIHYRVYVQGFLVLTILAGVMGKSMLDIRQQKKRGEIKSVWDFIKKNRSSE